MFAAIRAGCAAFAALMLSVLALIISVSFSTCARAQASIQQCSALIQQIGTAMQARNSKQIMLLERQYLTWCGKSLDGEDYELHLSSLASALIEERQFTEAIGVANRCLQSNPENLLCLAHKAEALFRSNNFPQSKTVIERAARLGAVSEFDVVAKEKLAKLLEEIHAKETRAAAATPGSPNAGVPVGVSGDVSCNGKEHVGLSISINGVITTKTAQDVEKLFRAYHAAEQGDQGSCTIHTKSGDNDFSAFGTHFDINSNGGDVVAAMAIGKLFRKEGAWLGVEGYCISSCVLVLAGAVDRQVSSDNVVGIHRPYLVGHGGAASADVATSYSNILSQIKSYLREMNVSTNLATDMLAVEPETVRMLSLQELQSYRLLGMVPAEQERRAVDREIDDVKEAEKLGLDRIEYTKRKARAKAICSADNRSYYDCYNRVMKTSAN